LIGASLGLAGKERGVFGEVIGVGRNRMNLETARLRGAVDRFVHDPSEVCGDADLVVLATPVASILSIGRQLASRLRRGTCVTDVGSVKQPLVEGLEEVLPEGILFVGGHPIAGSEASGAGAAVSGLFEGSRTILTPTVQTHPEALRKIRALWEKLGSRVIEMDAKEHDLLLAAVSHLPHMAAYALVNTLSDLEREGVADLSPYAAGGFKDITRIASSSPEMWRDICRMNREPILKMIDRYEAALNRIRELIVEEESDPLMRQFEKARDYRNAL